MTLKKWKTYVLSSILINNVRFDIIIRQLMSFLFAQAAMAAYLKDVENNTRDLTANRMVKEKLNKLEATREMATVNTKIQRYNLLN